MGKSKNNQLVPEDDPQFARFWAAYPHRVAKKEARKAWLEIGPSLELVDQMLVTLAWQADLWARTGYGVPYPASWLRAERWTDEPPRVIGAMLVNDRNTRTLTSAAQFAKDCERADGSH